MGKRSRESGGAARAKAGKENGNATGKPSGADDDYVAYASDGSDAPQLASSDGDSSEDSSDCEIPLGPVTARDKDDEDRMSDIDVSFEFFDPTSEDAQQVALLLSDYARETGLQSRPLADAIVAQTRVGTTVKITDEPAAVAFISCLNVLNHRQLLSGLLKAVEKAGGPVADALKASSESETESRANRMGLILTERVINLPPVLVAKMQEAAFCEIEWATEDEEEESDREAFKFARFLYVTDGFWKPSGKPAAESKGPPKRRRKEATASPEFMFARPEDEAWMNAADDMVSWPISGELPGAEGLVRKRVAMLVPASKVPSLREETCRIVGIVKCDSEKDAPDKDGK